MKVNDEYNLGAALKLTGSEMKECWPQLVYTPEDAPTGTYWLRGDVMRKVAAAGCTNNNMFGGYHTWEGRYTHGSTDGFMNSEYSLHTGFEFELSDKTTLSFGSNHAADSDCEM